MLASAVVTACATQTRFHKTYFSTPSAKNHPAYPFWTGDDWKGDNKSREFIEFPSDKQLKDGGRVCPDKQWRYIIDVETAVAMGCNLIDPAELKEEYSPEVYENLYMCVFVDDSADDFGRTHVHNLDQLVQDRVFKAQPPGLVQAQRQAHLTAVVRAAIAQDQPFVFEAVEHARHRAAVQGQVAAQLGRGVDAKLGNDDHHLELRGGDAVGFHVGVDDPVLEQRGTAEQQAEMAVFEFVRGEMLHVLT